MKKIIALILALASILSFASCGNTQSETTTATLGETTSADIPSETTKAPLETTAHTWNYPEPIVPIKQEGGDGFNFTLEQGENEFESFFQLYPGLPLNEDRKIKPLFSPEKYQEELPGCEPVFVLFRVLAREDTPYINTPAMTYYIQIVDVYGNVGYDTSRSYRVHFQGATTKQRYGLPDLEIGKIYGRFLVNTIDGEDGTQAYLDNDATWIAFPIFDVKEIDGKRYIYSYNRDISQVECAIPITDPEENNIYKVGKHDKQIAELERLGIPLPTFDYKCELDAFFTEYEQKLS